MKYKYFLLIIIYMLISLPVFSKGIVYEKFDKNIFKKIETTGIEWSYKENTIINSDIEKSFALFRNITPKKDVEINSKIRIEKTIASSWKFSGIGIYLNPNNYWHLALVESPDNEKKHYIELMEMFDGQWLAQVNNETKLTLLEIKGNGIWNFNEDYYLKIKISNNIISGSVHDKNNIDIYNIKYQLDNKSVKSGYPFLENSSFLTNYYNFSVLSYKQNIDDSKDSDLKENIQVLPKNKKLNSFFHLKNTKNKYWLIGPDNKKFYSIGIEHFGFDKYWSKYLGYAPYSKNMQIKYKNEKNWLTYNIKRLLKWGFNTLGPGHSKNSENKGLAHTLILDIGLRFSYIDDLIPGWRNFPNVFNPKFDEFCDKKIKELAIINKNDHLLIGYFTDNELQWGSNEYNSELFFNILNKDSKHTAKKALVSFFRLKYSKIELFNKIWKTNFNSWDDLLRITNLSVQVDNNISKDIGEFLKICAEKYFSSISRAIRKYDRNHLILGCRFTSQTPKSVLNITGKYVDIVSFNLYPTTDINPQTTFDKRLLIGIHSSISEYYKLTKRPVFITEWSFPVVDSKLPCHYGAGLRLFSQQERAYYSALMQYSLIKNQYTIGSSYFMWVDQATLNNNNYIEEDCNYGLVNDKDEYYKDLIDAFSKVNNISYLVKNENILMQNKAQNILKGLKNNIKVNYINTQIKNTPSLVNYKKISINKAIITNSKLIISKEDNYGYAFKVKIDNLELGSFTPVIWQNYNNINSWPAISKIESIIPKNKLKDGSLIFEIIGSLENKNLKSFNSPKNFRICYSFIISPDSYCIGSKLNWIENLDENDWELKAYFNFLSFPNNQFKDTIAFNQKLPYNLIFSSWYNSSSKLHFGILDNEIINSSTIFFIDSENNQHADAKRIQNLKIIKNKKYIFNENYSYIFVVKDNENNLVDTLIKGYINAADATNKIN